MVGTPIGNMRDITLRALDVLAEADVIAAEDTRHTRKLLSHHNIPAPRMMSLNADAEKDRIPKLLERLRRGETVAVVTSAGTPCSSDPGAALAAAAQAQGLPVRAVPGASAVASALSACGMDASRHVFEGFLPRSGAKRKKRLQAVAHCDAPVVIFESPRRIRATAADLYAACGDRAVSVHREMTKLHEENFMARLQHLAENPLTLPEKGEYTIVVDGTSGPGAEESTADERNVAAALDALTARGLSTRDAVDAASEILGLSRSAVYRVAKTKKSR